MINNNFPSDIELLKSLDRGNLEGIKDIFKRYYDDIDKTGNRFLLEEQLTIVSTKTLHEVFKEEFGADAIALYMFYYYTAKWQKTNQPKALSSYCKKGLEWGRDRFRRAKAILKKYNLIEDVRRKDKEGKIIGWYIRINYIWREKTIQTIKPQGGKTHRVVKQPPNALSDNNNKCLKRNKAKYSSIKDIGEVEFNLVANQYRVPTSLVRSNYENLINYCQAHGRRYKNYLAALRNFVKKDAGVNSIRKVPKPQVVGVPEITSKQRVGARKKLDEIRKKWPVKNL